MQTLVEQRDASTPENVQGNVKLCPFCAEKIQILAIKCRFCGEFLNKPAQIKPAGKWYYSMSALITALLSLGPLALPLVWINPKLQPWLKAAITVGTLVFTVLLCWAMGRAYASMMNQIQALGI